MTCIVQYVKEFLVCNIDTFIHVARFLPPDIYVILNGPCTKASNLKTEGICGSLYCSSACDLFIFIRSCCGYCLCLLSSRIGDSFSALHYRFMHCAPSYCSWIASSYRTFAAVQVTDDLANISKDYVFVIPPYFALILRAFSVLEGIGLDADPDYTIVDECYPYISKRLLTDDR